MEKITTNLTITLLIVVVFCSTILTYTIYNMDDYQLEFFLKDNGYSNGGKVNIHIDNPDFDAPGQSAAGSQVSIKIQNPQEE